MESELSPRDEADLRAYFRSFRPSVPGERSNLGAVCARLERGQRPNSDERPTPGTPWTEIVDCGHGDSATNFDGEDAMIAYVDARWRFGRIGAELASLGERDQRVLEAYYGTDPVDHPLGPVAPVVGLTEAARLRNRKRAEQGTFEPTDVTVRRLARTPGHAAHMAKNEMQREANNILRSARANFARAHAFARGRS